jgi:hypothetical protein
VHASRVTDWLVPVGPDAGRQNVLLVPVDLKTLQINSFVLELSIRTFEGLLGSK